MKTSILALIATVALASAQSLTDLPACALPCALQGLQSTTCSQTDLPCICRAQSFIETTEKCVAGTCSDADMQKTLQVASALCKGQGVTINVEVKAAGNSSMTSTAPVSTDASAATATATGSVSMITDKPAATTAAHSLAGALGTSTGTATGSSTVATYTGAADALKAGSWLGVAAFVGLVAL